MFDSTARAERIDLPSSETAFYAWEPAQKPVAVRLPLELIDRLESEAVETFRSLTSRGSEIGGLLLGSVTQGAPAKVLVTDFELVPCDYSRGPLYRLSDIDQGRLEQAIEKYSAGSGARVVGYFRSHTRKGLSLDAEDVAFFEPRFLEPQHIVLLVRPFATKASTAGIFIRENGRLGETSPLEFPFRSAELSASRVTGSAEPASPAASMAAPPPAAPKGAARAQIVPIASRREITLPEPTPAAAAPAPITAERVEPAPPEVKSATVETPAKVEKQAEKPVEKPVEKAKEKPATKAAAKTAEKSVATPAPAATPEPKPTPIPKFAADAVLETQAGSNKKLRLIVAAAIIMLVLVGGSLVVYPMLRNKLAPRTTTAQQDSSPLSLRVERTAGGMLLTWNRDLPVIQSATKVVLSISDGERHENIQLDPNQVRTGSILYPPITGDVSFQMEVTANNQAKTTSESLRVLDPRPSPLADPSDAPKQAAAKTGATTPGTGAETAASTPENKPEEPATPRPQLKQFNTQSLAQRLRPVDPTDLPDAPTSAVRPAAAMASPVPGVVTSQPALPQAGVPATNSGAPASTGANGATGVAQGGQIRPAAIISRVDPEYPRIARQAGASGVVELEATIDENGRVKNPHVLHGNNLLQKAAVDAVLQWRYRPATLNGKAVESPVSIKLNFVAH